MIEENVLEWIEMTSLFSTWNALFILTRDRPISPKFLLPRIFQAPELLDFYSHNLISDKLPLPADFVVEDAIIDSSTSRPPNPCYVHVQVQAEKHRADKGMLDGTLVDASLRLIKFPIYRPMLRNASMVCWPIYRI